ncbi:glycine cleavage system aminomethyltransferase GcvT [bacterium]|nr:glycine cleavage system aminomethyltransferase GcvT [bacterium]
MEATTDSTKKTPLFEAHKSLGARFVPFGGWTMPVQYSGIIEEHLATRNTVALFDVSHMGEFIVSGPGSQSYLNWVTGNDVSKLAPGKAQYTYFPNDRGGVVDDLIIYMLAHERYLLCVNASNTSKDFHWLKEKLRGYVKLENVSERFAQIAIQGPKWAEVLARTLEIPHADLALEKFPSFSFFEFNRAGYCTSPMIVARTGYTGEDGVEVFLDPKDAEKFWFGLLENGAEFGIKPAGLGARNSLRLEACFPLHGHELTDNIPALESGLGWVTKFDKGDFIGRQRLLPYKEKGLKHKLVGFEVLDPGIVREAALVYNKQGVEVGTTTSGTKTPTINKAIGLAIIRTDEATLGNELSALVRGKQLKIKIVKTPFYKRPQN